MKDTIKFKDLRLALVGVGCALIGFFTSYVLKPESEIQPIAENNVRVAMTHPGMFRKPGFIPCQTIIVREIQKAEESIHVQAYGFTCAEISEALCNAAKRGVKVRILLDKENETKQSDALRKVLDRGIEVKIRRISGISHNKVMIIDEKTVITGSFNFTKAANEKNDENLLILQNPEVAAQYLKHWHICYEGSHNLGEVVQLKAKPWQSKVYSTTPKVHQLAEKTKLNLKLKETKGPKLAKEKDKKTKQMGEARSILYTASPRTTLWIAVPKLKEITRENGQNVLNHLRNACTGGVDVRIVLGRDQLDISEKATLHKLLEWGAKVRVGNVKEPLVICDDIVSMPRKATKTGKLYPASFSRDNPNATRTAVTNFSRMWNSGIKALHLEASGPAHVARAST